MSKCNTPAQLEAVTVDEAPYQGPPWACAYCDAWCDGVYCDACASVCPECGEREAIDELKRSGGVCESCHDWQRDEDAGLHVETDEDYEQDKNW